MNIKVLLPDIRKLLNIALPKSGKLTRPKISGPIAQLVRAPDS